MNRLSLLKSNIEFKNFSWIVCGKILQMLLSLVVGMLTARYLGPDNYGIINYSTAYLSICMAISTLGITAVIVKNFTDKPNEIGLSIGTTILLRILTGIVCCVLVCVIVGIINRGQSLIIIVTLLVCLSLLFQPFDTFNYWFQYNYNAKVISIVSFIGFLALVTYRIFLLINKYSIQWFAFAFTFDYIVYGIFIVIAYKKYRGPHLKVSFEKAKELLQSSYHFILSSLMIVVYSYSDKIMLRQMLNDVDVGYYSIAVNICTIWTFVLTAIIDAIYPTIMNLFKSGNYLLYERKNRQLYAIIVYISVIVSLILTIFSSFIINLLYGSQFLPASPLLQVITWYTALSFLGVARNAWLVCEGKQKFLKYIYAFSALINVLLNFLMIPVWGALGSALASLITQFFSCLILPYLFKPLRPNVHLMLQAICLRNTK